MSDDSEFLRKMQDGDDSALEYFMHRYMDLLYYRALGIVHDPMVAEDIVQEGFIHLWDQRKKLWEASSVPAYLTRLVQNASINYLEHKSIRQRYADNFPKDIKDGEDGPDLDVEKMDELRKRLNDFIQTLPDKCRETFVLACVEGLKYWEVAERLDVSVNTVKSQIKRAYSKLRKEFNVDDQELILIILVMKYVSS